MLDHSTFSYEFWENFHFIRPWCLFLLIPAVFLSWSLFYRKKVEGSWHRYIDEALLKPLLQGNINKPKKMIPFCAALFWIMGTLALAGPTWQKLPQPVKKLNDSLVIVLNLSSSMLAADMPPSRLTIARHKILDLLKGRREGYTALIAYSGLPHIVAPLTDDNHTVANFLNALDPSIMPTQGSNVEKALSAALQLFHDGARASGEILLITDSITDQSVLESAHILQGQPYQLFIIGVGKEEGAPIPSASGGFIKDKQGNILSSKLETAKLKDLALRVNGLYKPLSLNDDDIQHFISDNVLMNFNALNRNTSHTEREFDQWRDMGPFICLLLLPLFALIFRRGSLSYFVVLLTLTLPKLISGEEFSPSDSPFWSLENLFLNDNQRGMRAMEKGEFSSAIKQFKDPEWQAVACYEEKDFQKALELFKQGTSDKSYYNAGNAQARLGHLDEAIKAYEEALKLNPDFEDAKFNKELVEQLLKNKQQEPSKEQQESSDNQKDSSEDPSHSEQDNSDDSDDKERDPSKGNESSPNDENPSKEEDNNEEKNQEMEEEQDQQQTNEDAQRDEKRASDTEVCLTEEEQALEQWLRKVPDDPSQLLRNKFLYQYQELLEQRRQYKN